jgi:sterol desaturase/sphingolipid hydroxylase (fatty acid hydroxylase superfamily)
MDQPDLIDPLIIAVPFFTALVIAEMLYGKRSGKARFEPRDSAASLIMGLGNLVFGAVFAGIVGGWLFLVSQVAILDLSAAFWTLPWAILAWPIVMIADDFVYYWSHRWAHTVRWFWADHVVHHSSQHYNLTTALRQPWFGVLTLKFMWLGSILVFLGVPPVVVGFVGALNLIYQFWIHTEALKKAPEWFEAVFNTPSHHRVHHATNPVYLDRNYAGILIIWDKMFGTFQPELEDEPCRYGIVRNLGTDNPAVIATHEWFGIVNDMVRAKSLKDAAMYLLGPPGWTPDGSRMTSKMLKDRDRERGGLVSELDEAPRGRPEAAE